MSMRRSAKRCIAEHGQEAWPRTKSRNEVRKRTSTRLTKDCSPSPSTLRAKTIRGVDYGEPPKGTETDHEPLHATRKHRSPRPPGPRSAKIAKEIFDELKNVETYLYWAINPEEKDGGLTIAKA